MQYAMFIEHNSWEGETWRFHFPIDGNEEALVHLTRLLDEYDYFGGTFEIDDTPLSGEDVDALVDEAEDGVFPGHTKLRGEIQIEVLEEMDEDDLQEALAEGGFQRYVT